MSETARMGAGHVVATSQDVRPESWMVYLFSLINPVVVITGNSMGGVWTVMGFVFTLIIGPIIDVLLGATRTIRPPRESGTPLVVILWIHFILHILVLGSLFALVIRDGWNLWVIVAAVSTGLHSGAAGIIIAHELGHAKPRSIHWWMAKILLFSVHYTHFTTEHNHNHHKWVGTDKDPASAHASESVYGFFLRTVPKQYLSAAGIQSRKGRKGLKNPIHQGMILQIAVIMALVLSPVPWGRVVALAWFLQAVVAVFLLEYANYIRHYGLRRAEDERISRHHAWQSEALWSRWTLFDLTRHSHHHLEASAPFWKLRTWDDAPHLPVGYYGCFWICMIPPLWKRWMRPKLAACHAASESASVRI